MSYQCDFAFLTHGLEELSDNLWREEMLIVIKPRPSGAE